MAYIPCLRIEDFNPRSPCGERPGALSGGKGQRLHFNPRSPCGERLFPHTQSPSQCPFQSTLPVRGATRKPTSRRRRRAFQSTLPVRGATKTGRAAYMGVKFQSTLPVRGATHNAWHNPPCPDISIHAPRAGSDLIGFDSSDLAEIFQSTLPVRGATPAKRGREHHRGISIHAPRAGSDVRA